MTPDHFRLACVTLWGPRWQGDSAVVLDITTRRIRAFLAGEQPIPDGIRVELLDLLLDKVVACHDARRRIMGLDQEDDETPPDSAREA